MAAETTREQDFQKRIHTEQIDILFQHIPLAQATNIVVATVLAWFLWGTAAQATIIGWWLAVFLIVLVRLVMYYYRPRSSAPRIPWHSLMTGATALSGIAWGAAGILFFIPDSAATLIFLTIILAGMSAGSIASHSSWPPAQFAYAILTMTPIALRYLTEEGDLWVLGPMCLIYLFNILAFARQLSRTLIESIRLRLEKQELAQKLRDEMTASEQARSRAEEASRAKSKFLAAASHDLRQPLHAVNLFIEALRNEKDPARAELVLTYLSTSAQSLEELLNELLDISKLEAGLFKPHIKVLSLQEVFDALEHELQPVADEKDIGLRFVPTRLSIASDPNMLGRILRNIINNAIRYTDTGAVLVGCRRKGTTVAITISDTGPGIATEHHLAIFREFYQLGNPERDRRKGLGLGLAIVDGLCRVLDHPLELKSRIGHGSTFAVHVPIAAADPTCDEIVKAETPVPLENYGVLIIDDEPAICRAMNEVLRSWGCRVVTAESGQDALAQLSTSGFVPDVIIADYRLREGHTGANVIAEIRQSLGKSIPAAILTGDTAPERLREASAGGFVLLHKPIQPSRLRAALTNWREDMVAIK
jgi:signal transduction histidine kinase/CheY-like chemotaxis protein